MQSLIERELQMLNTIIRLELKNKVTGELLLSNKNSKTLNDPIFADINIRLSGNQPLLAIKLNELIDFDFIKMNENKGNYLLTGEVEFPYYSCNWHELRFLNAYFIDGDMSRRELIFYLLTDGSDHFYGSRLRTD